MVTRFKLGTNVRAWVEFEVKDATPEEIAILELEGDAAVELAETLDEAGRLTWQGVEYEGDADYFADYAEPAVMDFEVIDEEAG